MVINHTTPSARVVSVQDDLVTIETITPQEGRAEPLVKNGVVFILPSRLAKDERQEYLKAEILRIRGNRAEAQVYESTTGVGVGDAVVQSQAMLSADLGPGLLGSVFDGLQNPLVELALQAGTFLPRGLDVSALDEKRQWLFKPSVAAGADVFAGDFIGTVAEGRFVHRIMAPLDLVGQWRVEWVREGSFTVSDTVAELKQQGASRLISLRQKWPVRLSITRVLTSAGRAKRCYPNTPLATTVRIIDTFFPIAKGGTGCIPGPFGAGKTVLQGLISRYSDVDIVIVVACGERAGEVVETIKEFPSLNDPKSGGSLMDRTIIICNTSSMPVAAREASIYTGITLGEYYQSMGYDVLLIADSTSRWAQAMRETSGRLEEIPGEEAFPAYLDSAIKGVYERAGVCQRTVGDSITGSLTMIGTVSPAGGNFEEPVTQATLGTVKAFWGLSADRAYKRFYPAIDPLQSWSRYGLQMDAWYRDHVGEHWRERVARLTDLLAEGEEVDHMMQVTGEEGCTTEDFITLQQALLLDATFLQQDAFDDIDASCNFDRQIKLLTLIETILQFDLALDSKADIRAFYTKLTGLLKNLNYSSLGSSQYNQYESSIIELLKN